MKFSDLGINSPTRLRDLVRQVRSARTAAEERAIAQKESAAIRDYFRNEDNLWRSRNVAKLLYLYLLGYPAHFGQLECLKLIASKSFTDKRIGYLGATLLLDERQDTHLLMTNSLKNDLKSDNQYVIGLALSAFAAVCSVQMCRDVLPEIDKLINSSNSYIRKKAILCAVRIVEKVPECAEVFTSKIKFLLTEKNHSTVTNGTVLLAAVVDAQPSLREFACTLLPNAIRALRSLLMSGYNPDYDVGGITDPFLQIAIIRFIRKVGSLDTNMSENITEILAQLAGSTEVSKNVSNALLYDTVLAILSLKTESSLKVLAVDILGRFLLSPDKNVRYVALGTLLQIVNVDRQTVQKHRETIAECLYDFDPSVKRRAMQLTFAITDSTNVQAMIASMQQFLSTCEAQFKGDCTSDMFTCLDKYGTDKRWQIDQAIEILRLAGNYVRDDLVSSVISLISSVPEYHKYVCRQLYVDVSRDQSQQPLCQTACWCFGEYADKMLTKEIYAAHSSDFLDRQVTEDGLVDLVGSVLRDNRSSVITKAYALNSLMKLSAKISSSCLSKVSQLLSEYVTSTSLELQTRASEYMQIIKHHSQLRKDLFARMPTFVSHSASLKIPNIDENKQPLLDVLKDTEKPADSLLIEFGSSAGDEVHPNGTQQTEVTALDKDGLLVLINLFKTEPCVFRADLRILNKTDFDFTDFLLQAAVPKSFKLTVLQADGSTIPANQLGEVRQSLVVRTPAEKKPKLRLRLFYTRFDDLRITEQTDFSPS